MDETGPADEGKIAIVGIAGRFPGADDHQEFWRNLRDGVDSIRDLDVEQLHSFRVAPHLIADPSYVWSSGHLEGLDTFDAAFFGYSPREAALMDPQHRLFLECSWAALEDAGYRPRDAPGQVGVYGGSAINKYLIRNVLSSPDAGGLEGWDGGIPPGSSPDAMPSRVAYQLGLTGPSIAVQTACSSALSAVCLAADGLRSYACDTALAGGVSVELPEVPGYRYHEGGLVSRDGRCRPYSADASGSVFGSGVGVVVLRRLADALADGDHVYAVLPGWAVNNDGRGRAGYSAPGVDGQVAVVVEALRMADLGPADLQYVEGHGSGTPVGDQIEMRALTRAITTLDPSAQPLHLGSVKSNIGHVDAAAGVAGLIKTVHAVRHGELPPTLHHVPPPEPADDTPLRVVTKLTRFSADGPRRAGVSSFGMGGANAHVIVEQAPEPAPAPSSSPHSLFVVSAASEAALEHSIGRLAEALGDSDAAPEDVAFTLATGRAELAHRHAVVAPTLAAASALLRDAPARHRRGVADSARPVAFMFPGVGDAYAGVATDLYRTQPAFRAAVDDCAALLASILDDDIRDHLFPEDAWRTGYDGEPGDAGPPPGLTSLLRAAATDPGAEGRTVYDQPATFVLEFALAQLYLHWGVRPRAMIGHSVGEYVAACLAGVFSLGDALRVVAERAKAIGGLPRGGMLAVPLPEAELRPLLGDDLWIGAVNTPELVVVSGLDAALDRLQATLKERGLISRRVRAEHPYHSPLVSSICGDVARVLETVTLHPPTVPYISGSSGTWVTDEQATDREYWTTHICHPVRFAEGVGALAAERDLHYLELGPGQSLTAFTVGTLGHHGIDGRGRVTGAIHAGGDSASRTALAALGALWVDGCEVALPRLFENRSNRRVALPTYPFERRRHWIERATVPAPAAAPAAAAPAAGTAPAAVPAVPVPRAAPQPAPAATANATGGTDAASLLRQVWQDLLGYDQVSVHDDFFQLGGHSLLALQAVNKLWQDHRIELPVSAILHGRTIAVIASSLPDVPAAEPIAAAVPPAPAVAAPAPAPAVAAPATDPETFTGLVTATLTRSLGWQPGEHEPLRANEIVPALPDLILGVDRALGMRVYPEELEAHRSVASLADYLRRQHADWQQSVSGSAEPVRHDNRVDSPTAFVLSSPRAGSTLLRVMLAGHPDLFCPPELHLLATRTMSDRVRTEPGSERDQGLIRALMELTGLDARECGERVAAYYRRDAPTGAVFGELASLASPRMLVDKSPGNARNAETLRAIAELAPQARYLQLVRHPLSVIESIVRNRFTRLMGADRFDPVEFGEHVWTQYNVTIQEFLSRQGSDSHLVLRYEDLVRRPEETMRDVCRTLGIAYSPAVLTPYEGRRMRDGLGDPNFLTHSAIDASLADAWSRVRLPRRLNRLTRQLAAEFGYDLP